MNKQNIVMDATLLTSLMNCPRMSDFRFNLNLQQISGKSNSLEVGSIVHKFLESFYGKIIDGMKREAAIGYAFTDAEMYIQGCPHCTDFIPYTIESESIGDNMIIDSIEINNPTCGHEPNEYPGVYNTPKENEGHLIGWQYALDTCQQYVDYYRNDHIVPIDVETVKSKILYEDDEIRILWKAKLDLTADNNQGIYPYDHKTMKQNRNTNSMNNQFIGQCLIMNTRNVFINKIGFQKTLPPEEKFIRQPISYSASRLLEWQSETLPYYAKLLLMYASAEHFPPNFTNCESKYGNCNFLKVCEADPSDRERELKLYFKVGPTWNPTNTNDEE